MASMAHSSRSAAAYPRMLPSMQLCAAERYCSMTWSHWSLGSLTNADMSLRPPVSRILPRFPDLP